MSSSLTYAIGDVHGRLDLLEKAFGVIGDHSAGRAHQVITLGDYVDRGPDGAGVIAYLRAAESAGRIVCLKGNHEAMMVKAIRTGDHDHWMRNGGEATLASYGGKVPEDDIAWLDALPVTYHDGLRVFVHGGVEPGVALADQDPHTMMWIRDKFLAAPGGTFSFHVVHAHTPVWDGKPDGATPERLPHRTNLDTGAYKTGVLSIGVFDSERPGAALEVLQVRGAPREDAEEL